MGVLAVVGLSLIFLSADGSTLADDRASRAPVLVKLESQLRVLLEGYHPGVRIEIGEGGLAFEHDTRTFLVPEYLKAGQPRKMVEVMGPSPCAAGRTGGVLGSIRVVPGRYAGQRAVLPGVFFQGGTEANFENLWGVVPSPKETEHLDVTLLYPACANPEFLTAFQEIVGSAWRDVGPAAGDQAPTLKPSEVTAFIGTWPLLMTNPVGAQETIRVWEENGAVAASAQAGRFPATRATGIMKDGNMLVLTLSRFENGKPIWAVIALTLDGNTMNMAQMLEQSQTIKRGSGQRADEVR